MFKKLFVTALCTSAAFAQIPAIDWDQQKAEILRHYRALVQLDTSNPPGNETRVVEYLKKVLEDEGIPTKTFALDPKRANIVARLKGNGSKKPLLILAHSDVVGVQREKWPVDPFGAVLKDGYIWGRGTRDDKPILAANLMVMLLLKRGNVPLDRDVIFLAEASEEADTTGVGINFMLAQHFDEVNAEFSLTEGGGATLVGNKVTIVNIGTAEKVPARIRLIANGTSGHGSIPRLDNAVTHLSAAVEKVGTWETPMRLNDTTRSYFEKLATISSPDDAARYNSLLESEDCTRGRALSARARSQPLLDAANVHRAHHAESRDRPQRDSVGSRGHDRYSRPAGRKCTAVFRGTAEADRRSGGENRAATHRAPAFAAVECEY